MTNDRLQHDTPAITGMACQFPGAEDLDAYWQLIKHNKIATRQSSSTALPADYCRRELAGGFIKGVEQFDAEFFGISNREAQLMDPQQRLLLQNIWHAIEDAGIAPSSLRGSKTGVFVGAMANDWAARSIIDNDDLNSQMMTGNGLALLANRVSYHYDFKGPSYSVDSACSASMVALNTALQSLRNGDCDYAIVAGVNVIATPTLQRFYQRSGIASVKGQCQPFSRYSDGIVRGEGVGVLFLQRVPSTAKTYATLVGSTVNHNGQSNGLSAPNRFSQQSLLNNTYQQFGVSPAEIGYVECHGTGTDLGDRIELQALTNVLKVPERQTPCHIGSVKGLIGHTEAAAGIAGVIKLALMLHHGYIPASLYADTPNAILEKNSTLKLPPLGYSLPAGQDFYAGISSFGLGGTNGHLVLKRSLGVAAIQPEANEPQLITLSAPTLDALADQARALSTFLDGQANGNLAELAAASRAVKSQQRVKKAWVAASAESLHKQLRQFSLSPVAAKKAVQHTALYFSGAVGESQVFGQSLFDHAPTFREALERCDSLFYPLLGHSIISLMFARETSLNAAQHNLWLPALFSWHYAQAQLLIKEGVTPGSLLGEGIGEYVAACLSGLISLPEAVYLVAQHAEILHLQQVIDAQDFVMDATAPFEKYQQFFKQIPQREPHTPFISCARGKQVSSLRDSSAWLQLFDSTEQSAEHRQTALAISPADLIIATKVSPEPRDERQWLVVNGGGKLNQQSDHSYQQHLEIVAQLYSLGVAVKFNDAQRYANRAVPHYSFQTTGFWLAPVSHAPTAQPVQSPVGTATAAVAPTSVSTSVSTSPPATQHVPAVDHSADEFVARTLASILGCDPSAFKLEMRLSEDLGLDSIVVIELIERLNKGLPEKHKLAFTDTMTIVTVADLNKRVATLIKNGKAVAEEKV